MKIVDTILYEIPDIKKAHSDYKNRKRLLNKDRNRLQNLLENYSFLNDIVSKNIDDFELEFSILKLFKALGFKATKPKTTRDIDVLVKTIINQIGIEVKNTSLPAENELFQAKKYAVRHENKGNLMHPLIIWNNAKTNQNFDSYRIEDAELNKYGLLTTKELLKGFLKIKKGKLSIEDFVRLINRCGLIEFTNKSIKNLDRSVSV